MVAELDTITGRSDCVAFRRPPSSAYQTCGRAFIPETARTRGTLRFCSTRHSKSFYAKRATDNRRAQERSSGTGAIQSAEGGSIEAPDQLPPTLPQPPDPHVEGETL